MKVEYSNVRTNINIVREKILIKPQYLNMAVSKENGVEAYRVYDNPLNS